MSVKLVEVLRGKQVESNHRGDLAVVNARGQLLYEMGNVERVTFFRSASKPLQAIAALEMGIVDRFKFDLKEIAICAASHSGEKEHVDVLKGMLQKVGIEEKDLICGAHEPINKEAARELAQSGESPTRLHCNCAGKHIGLIAAAKAKGFAYQGYQELDHPVQKKIDAVLSDFCDIKQEELIKGYDGCGIPVHALPIRKMAQAYANLCNKEFLDGKYSASQNYILSAMTMYPEMVAGKGRMDTELMRLFGDRLIGKVGAEGVYCIGLPGRSAGLALKIDDGNSRAVGPAVLEALVQMKVVSKDEMEPMLAFWKPEVLNHRGDKVGQIRPAFKMD